MSKSYYKNVFIHSETTFHTSPVPGSSSHHLSKISQAIIDAGYNITSDINLADKIYISPHNPDLEKLKHDFGEKVMLTLK